MKAIPWLLVVIAVCAGIVVALQASNRADLQAIETKQAQDHDALAELARRFDDYKGKVDVGLIDLGKKLADLQNNETKRRRK